MGEHARNTSQPLVAVETARGTELARDELTRRRLFLARSRAARRPRRSASSPRPWSAAPARAPAGPDPGRGAGLHPGVREGTVVDQPDLLEPCSTSSATSSGISRLRNASASCFRVRGAPVSRPSNRSPAPASRSPGLPLLGLDEEGVPPSCGSSDGSPKPSRLRRPRPPRGPPSPRPLSPRRPPPRRDPPSKEP